MNQKGFTTPIIAIILIIAAGIGGYVLVQYRNIKNENISAVKTRDDLNLQTKCADMAGKYFTDRGYKNSEGFDYKNHFNSRLNKCFILISSYDMNNDFLSIDLYDAVEGNRYAAFFGHNICDVNITNNPKKCLLDYGNIWFDGNDTRNPADFTVGFRGLKNGGDAGDETTQKGFVNKIQPFMSE